MAESCIERAHLELLIESWSNSARTILLRGHASGGPFAEQHTTNADRTRAADTFQLHGEPISLTATHQTAPVRRGECYVRATLMLDGEPVLRLFAAYLTDGKALSWPDGVHEGFTEGPGLIRLVSGTDPAAGAEHAEAVPANTRWKIRDIRIVFVTDATVENRVVRLMIDDGANWMYDILAINHAASLTRFYLYVPGIGYLETTFDNSGNIRLPLIPDPIMYQGWRIVTATTNLQAGDNYGPPLIYVEEWIEE